MSSSREHTNGRAANPTDIPTADVLGTVRDYIAQELLRRPDVKLSASTPLIEQGYLTSLQAVELVLFLAEHFEIEIEPEEVNEENFRSLATIAALIEGKT